MVFERRKERMILVGGWRLGREAGFACFFFFLSSVQLVFEWNIPTAFFPVLSFVSLPNVYFGVLKLLGGRRHTPTLL